jgi:hypothetical protein
MKNRFAKLNRFAPAARVRSKGPKVRRKVRRSEGPQEQQRLARVQWSVRRLAR